MTKKFLIVPALASLITVAAVFAATGGKTSAVAMPALHPTVTDYHQLTSNETPPTEANCFAGGRRCFTPQSIQAAYNLGLLYAGGKNGSGYTIAIVDSFGSDTMAHDLHVFNNAFGLQHMCGEEDVTCAAGMPKFSELSIQGSPATMPQGGQGTGLEDKTAWAVEVALDVEWAHSVAPGANILLVHTPTAETLGVQGFPPMMMAEDYIVKHHLANVISQSFGSSEDAFGSPQSLLSLRYAFQDAKDNDVTVLASSGDFGSTNETKQSLTGAGAGLIPFPNVLWPASDPLVTAVGGTYLCTDPNNTAARVVDNTDPPTRCQAPASAGQAEVGWIDSGGGFSHVFSRPDYQGSTPAGSTAIPAAQRGVPDIAYQASSTTGVLVYVSLPPDGSSGFGCAGVPCSTGWYVVGGTSSSAPQWAGLVAITDQIAGHGVGLINPALYQLASNPTTYADDFFDVTVGSNVVDPSIPGYSASPGWDPVTGLGTPNAANLLPALAAAAG